MSIPIAVGVTGHRSIREEDIPFLKETVYAELQKLKNEYPDSPFIMLNSLASGADTLCAEAGISLGMSLVCPLPFEIDEYRKDFPENSRFDELVRSASEVFAADFAEQPKEDLTDEQMRNFAYRQAGIYVASHSHVLLALWDGKEGTGCGCGTAETVGFMLEGNYRDGRSILKSTNDGAVIHIKTPRAGNADTPEGAVLIENESGSLKSILSLTNEFNRECRSLPETLPEKNNLIPEKYLKEDSRLSRIHEVYLKADALSLRLQKRYLSVMKCFSVFGVLLVLAFLLYDEMESDIFLPVYGLVMILYLVIYLISKKHGAHMKYLQYRILAESMRVQLFLCASGINENIGNAFTWTQKHESTWVKEAAGAMITGKAGKHIPDEINKKSWIDDQLEYHKKALKRNDGKFKINERTARGMLIASVILFLIVFAFEFLAKGLMTHVIAADFPKIFLFHEGQEFTVRSLTKILLGVISAVTVFLSHYYDKLSFGRKTEDHEKMMRLYRAADERYEESDKEELLLSLAKEEIIENGNWMSYCRENAPTFNL